MTHGQDPVRQASLRLNHLLVLQAAQESRLARSSIDYEYRVAGQPRVVSPAVYLLESYDMLLLGVDGTVLTTSHGLSYLLKHRAELSVVTSPSEREGTACSSSSTPRTGPASPPSSSAW